MTAFNVNTTAEEVGTALSKEITGKNVIITGPTWGGIASEAARVIAKYASLVVLAGRSKAKIEETIENIKKETPKANLRPLVLDLASLASVREAAAEFNKYPETFNVLINSAAIMAAPYDVTTDGFESQMGINHFGPFLFTSLIFPRIAAAGTAESPARIVNISSWGHNVSGIRFDDVKFGKNGENYDVWAGYGQSKTANILFANEIARRSKEKRKNVVAYSVHPGGILGTGLGKYITNQDLMNLGLTNEAGEWLMPTKTVQCGAATYMFSAFDPSIIPNSGAYLADSELFEDGKAPHAKSQENGEKLWVLSEEAVGQRFII